MMGHAPLAIDAMRLKRILDGLNAFGRRPDGGFDRPAFSDADMAVRRWFRDEMNDAGLAASIDPVGNVVGRYGDAPGPVVMVGSHLDTVPAGGAFDGALGCAVALECVLSLRDANWTPSRSIEVVATADEEGRFGGMLGSQALCGTASAVFVEGAADAEGVRLCDAMRAQGLDPARVGAAARAPGSVAAFLELHIEQGPLLEAKGCPIAIATHVSGVCVLGVRLTGRSNHSGTTPMDMRADAFLGLAAVGAALAGIAADHGTDQSRLTVGHVRLSPNEPHTIAGEASFTVVVRDTDRAVMARLVHEVRRLIDEAAASHGLERTVDKRSWLDPVTLDGTLAETLARVAHDLGIAHLTLPSGAGHDAATMAALCPSALVFVPSRNGISHAPAEWTDWEDIVLGATLILNALAALTRSR